MSERKEPTREEISRVLSYVSRKMTPKKKRALVQNGKNRRKHYHVFEDGVKCNLCNKYLSQFGGRNPNEGMEDSLKIEELENKNT